MTARSDYPPSALTAAFVESASRGFTILMVSPHNAQPIDRRAPQLDTPKAKPTIAQNK